MTMEKKGISPLIAAVLLTAFTITLFLLISTWVQRTIVEESTTKTEEKFTGQMDCMNTAVKVSNACILGPGGTPLRLNVDNIGSTTVTGLTIRVVANNGAVTTTAPLTGTWTPLVRIVNKLTPIALAPAIASPARIEVYPSIATGVCTGQVETVTYIPVDATCGL